MPAPSIFSKAVPIPATLEALEKFIEDVVVDIDNGRKKVVTTRLREGLFASIRGDDLAAIEMTWRNCAANSEMIVESDYLQQHADLVRDVVCDARIARKEIATEIVNRIWEHGISDFSHRPDYKFRLARGLLGRDGKDCAATKDLSDETKERLHADASTPAPTD